MFDEEGLIDKLIEGLNPIVNTLLGQLRAEAGAGKTCQDHVERAESHGKSLRSLYRATKVRGSDPREAPKKVYKVCTPPRRPVFPRQAILRDDPAVTPAVFSSTPMMEETSLSTATPEYLIQSAPVEEDSLASDVRESVAEEVIIAAVGEVPRRNERYPHGFLPTPTPAREVGTTSGTAAGDILICFKCLGWGTMPLTLTAHIRY